MKRQTEAQGIIRLWVPEALDVDPFTLPAKYKIKWNTLLGKCFRALDEVRIGQYSILIRSYSAGVLVDRNWLSLRDFQGIALRLSLMENSKDQFAVSINLHHEKQRFCIPLHFAYDLDVSIARLQTWSRRLRLPILMPAQDGTWYQPITTTNNLGVQIKPAVPRPARQYLKGRKAILSNTRHVGQTKEKRYVQGREIIARD